MHTIYFTNTTIYLQHSHTPLKNHKRFTSPNQTNRAIRDASVFALCKIDVTDATKIKHAYHASNSNHGRDTQLLQCLCDARANLEEGLQVPIDINLNEERRSGIL